MPQNGKAIYTAKTHTVGGREHGAAKSSDGRLDIKLSVPGQLAEVRIPSSYSLPVGRLTSKEQWASPPVK